MPSSTLASVLASTSFDPRQRGYVVAFRPQADNICPGCGGRHWYVGRMSAECARCATALPIVDARRGTALSPTVLPSTALA